MLIPTVLAAAKGAETAETIIPPGAAIVVMIGLWIAIIYFIGIRPKKKHEDARKGMLDALKKNDKVVTTAGILGVVTHVKDKEVTVRVDDSNGTKIRFTRDAITAVVTADGQDAKEKDKGKVAAS